MDKNSSISLWRVSGRSRGRLRSFRRRRVWTVIIISVAIIMAAVITIIAAIIVIIIIITIGTGSGGNSTFPTASSGFCFLTFHVALCCTEFFSNAFRCFVGRIWSQECGASLEFPFGNRLISISLMTDLLLAGAWLWKRTFNGRVMCDACAAVSLFSLVFLFSSTLIGGGCSSLLSRSFSTGCYCSSFSCCWSGSFFIINMSRFISWWIGLYFFVALFPPRNGGWRKKKGFFSLSTIGCLRKNDYKPSAWLRLWFCGIRCRLTFPFFLFGLPCLSTDL